MEATANLGSHALPMSEFGDVKLKDILGKVRQMKSLIVTENNRPAAVVLSSEEYERMREQMIDNELLLEAVERLQKPQKSYSQEEVMQEFGITPADLDAVGDVEIE